jgi:HPt (histidine-containing phosphotransfer) domain-containing protein
MWISPGLPMTGPANPVSERYSNRRDGKGDRDTGCRAQERIQRKAGSQIFGKAPMNTSMRMNRNGGDNGVFLDKTSLIDAFGHDWQLLKETVQMLIEDYPPMLTSIQKALADGDADALKRAAHSLKGMAGNFQATAAEKTALRLEQMGRKGDISNARAVFDRLVRQMESVRQGLLKMIEEE